MSGPKAKRSLLGALGERLGLGDSSEPKYRIFICGGPDCCDVEDGSRSFKHLKKRLKERGLTRGPGRVAAVKTECMNVCGGGPIAVVYPEKVWYEKMNPDRIDRVVKEHFVQGKPVAKFSFRPAKDVREPR